MLIDMCFYIYAMYQYDVENYLLLVLYNSLSIEIKRQCLLCNVCGHHVNDNMTCNETCFKMLYLV